MLLRWAAAYARSKPMLRSEWFVSNSRASVGKSDPGCLSRSIRCPLSYRLLHRSVRGGSFEKTDGALRMLRNDKGRNRRHYRRRQAGPRPPAAVPQSPGMRPHCRDRVDDAAIADAAKKDWAAAEQPFFFVQSSGQDEAN